MNQAMKNLLYQVADTFQIPLRLTNDQRITGEARPKLNVGPFTLKADMLVKSDFVKADTAGVFVKIRKRLWAYCLVSPGYLAVYLFDAVAAKVKTDEVEMFATGNAESTLKKLGPGIKAQFLYSTTKQRWERVDAVDDLDAGVESQGTVGAESCSAA